MADPLLDVFMKLTPEQRAADIARANEYLASEAGQREFGDLLRPQCATTEDEGRESRRPMGLFARIRYLEDEVQNLNLRVEALEAAR